MPRIGLATSLGLLAALVAFVIGAKSITDNSLLTHLATGDLILSEHSVPTTDPYSRTASGVPWTVQSWLASIVYASIEHIGGGAALRLLHGAIAAMIGAGVWRLTGPATQVVPRTALTMMPVMIGAGLWSPRPFMFGLLAMVGLLTVIRTEQRPWLLIPLFWVWVNSHGSFPLGVALLGAMLLGALIDVVAAGEDEVLAARQTVASLARYLWFAIGGVLLGAVNPIGPRILWFPIQLLGRREALDGVVEWQPPSFTSTPEIVFLGLLPVVAVAASRGAQWRALLPSICFLMGGFLAIRNISIAAVVVVVLLAPSFRDLLGAEDGTTVNALSRSLGPTVAVSLVFVVAVVLSEPGLDLKLYPTDEVDYLEDRGLTADADVGLIHREAVGNYLAYRYGPESSVFIDDRFDFYPTALSADHLRLLDGGDYEEILDRRHGDVVLWEADSLLAHWLAQSDEWELVIDRDKWVVACRIDSPVFARCAARD